MSQLPPQAARAAGAPSALDASSTSFARGATAPTPRVPAPGGETALALDAVLCTEELVGRPSREPDHDLERRALATLVRGLAGSPGTILQSLADTILGVFSCDSAGVSLVTEDGSRFQWPAIAGVWKQHIGGGTPREFGPCGDVLDRNRPLMFRHPERRYDYFLTVSPLIDEALLVPFYVEGKAVGTIWAIMHEAPQTGKSMARKFDREDLRLLESLGRFASTAYQVWTALRAKNPDAEAVRMQTLSALHQHANARFREVFGEPNRASGPDHQWSLSAGAYRASINVLIGGNGDQPTYWIFDPHHLEETVATGSITHVQRVDEIIRQIQNRVQRAATLRGHAQA